MPDNNLLKHPAEFYIRYLLIRDPAITDAQLAKTLLDGAFLTPDEAYYGFVRQKVRPIPDGFDPANRLHRPTTQFLRQNQVYELFFPTPAVEEAWSILTDHSKRMIVEQALMSRLDLKMAASRLNKKHGWFLTQEGLTAFRHFFWNVNLLSFDEWGRFLYGRTAFYEKHMALLDAAPALALYHLRIEQQVESKKMISRAQEIAYFTLEELAQKPGTGTDKVKGIGMLTKAITDCHEALSTSDMALKDALKQFERFRMEYPTAPPKDIRELAPTGNFTNSGADAPKEKAAAETEGEVVSETPTE